jgi:phospholipid N-methyltransferase
MVKYLRSRIVFYGQAIKQAQEVGAFSHTSRVVADAVAEPVRQAAAAGGPLRVLEVGAGTGALTRAIVEHLRPGDTLDLVEINTEFAKVLRDLFPTRPDGPQVNVLERDIDGLPAADYDVIVSSLPLMNLSPEKVQRVFERYLTELLRPGGTLSYYDYWAKEVRTFLTGGRERRRMREVLRVTKEFRDRYEVRDRLIPWNVLPALVHYLERPL